MIRCRENRLICIERKVTCTEIGKVYVQRNARYMHGVKNIGRWTRQQDGGKS